MYSADLCGRVFELHFRFCYQAPACYSSHSWDCLAWCFRRASETSRFQSLSSSLSDIRPFYLSIYIYIYICIYIMSCMTTVCRCLCLGPRLWRILWIVWLNGRSIAITSYKYRICVALMLILLLSLNEHLPGFHQGIWNQMELTMLLLLITMVCLRLPQ